MNILSIIEKKKLGKKLTSNEIQFFVDGVVNGKIKDYQTTSLLMAICLNDIDFDETYNLTMSMAKSGEMVDLTDVGDCFDKHSTGGVSDTTTLVIVPILASLGVKVAKMSGRSLGFTGGTADKMEVFKGYKTEIDTAKFKELIKKNNASIVSPSEDIAIADKIIYKLRSESGTVENIGLIASSIMSKKIACGAQTIMLDCKYGSGAFMKTLADCKKLANVMALIGKRAGLKVIAVISNMNQPLSNFIGNNFEVYSAIKVLSGEENNLAKLSKFLCANALIIQGKAKNVNEANVLVESAIKTGKAKEMLKKIVSAQGGDTSIIDSPERLLPTNSKIEICADVDGYVESMDTSLLGNLSHLIQYENGTYKRQDDAGIVLNKNIGDYVKRGELLLTIYYNHLDDESDIISLAKKVIQIGKKVEYNLVDEIIS